MISLAMGFAVLFAVIIVGARRWRRDRLKFKRPGTSLETAIVVDGFDGIDAYAQGQHCAWCDGRLSESGETSRSVGERRYRIVRLLCHECERPVVLYFDVTSLFH